MRRIIFYEPVPRGSYNLRRFALPRLGSLILGTILKKAGYDVSVYVEDICPPTTQELLEADLVGLSPLTPSAPRAYEVAQELRGRGVRVVFGGPHVTFLPNEALQYSDYVFRGEADNVILQLVKAIETGEGLEEVPGLSFRWKDEIVHNRPAEPVMDLDALPDPDFSLLKGGLSWIAPVSTSRGCPHDCTFCSVTRMFGRRYRFRAPERVLDELETIDFSKRRVIFCDDHFAADKHRLRTLLQGMLTRNLDFGWSAQARVDIGKHEDILGLMKRAGCRTLYVGLESVNPDTLKAYHKGQTLSQIEHSIRAIHRHDLRIYGMFIFGADSDTIETVRATLQFAMENRIDTIQLSILTPLPGTACYKELDEQGRIISKDWSLYNLHNAVFEPARMNRADLLAEVYRALRKFYSIPRIIGDILRFRFFEARAKAYNRWYHVQAARSAMVSRVCQATSKANP